MIVVDASAICAITLSEPDRAVFLKALKQAEGIFMSALGVWEAKVVSQRHADDGGLVVNQLLAELRATVISIGAEDADFAFNAWRRFGKGRHPAGLNLGDCFAYALAKSRDLPLLYKGDDFAKTDVTSAI